MQNNREVYLIIYIRKIYLICLGSDMIIDLKLLEDVIMSEPQVLKRIYNEARGYIDEIAEYMMGASHIILTGCGDSYFSSLYGMHLLEGLARKPSCAENAYELSRFRLLPKNSIVVAFSASGRTAATLSAVMKSKKSGVRVVGVTCKPDSPIVRESDKVIIVNADDKVPAPTVTSMCFLYVLSLISVELGNRLGTLTPEAYNALIQQLCDIEKYLRKVGKAYRGIRDEFMEAFFAGKHSSNIYFIGGGPNYPVSLFAMAKLCELNLSHSIAFELEEFLHYGNIPISTGDMCVLISSGPANGRARDAVGLLEKLGSEIFVISDQILFQPSTILIPSISYFLAPILSLYAIHQIALDLAKKKYRDKVEIRHGEDISRIIRRSEVLH